jgi:hypothetical protein
MRHTVDSYTMYDQPPALQENARAEKIVGTIEELTALHGRITIWGLATPQVSPAIYYG